MRKWLRRLVWVGAVVVLAPLAAGLFIIWPFPAVDGPLTARDPVRQGGTGGAP